MAWADAEHAQFKVVGGSLRDDSFHGAPVRDVGGDVPRDVMRDLKESLDRVRRPVESAGSGGPVPPAGVAAPPVSSPAGGAPVTSVLEAYAGALRAQGMAPSQATLVARRAIVSGKVVIDGDVCTDPDALVDPRSMA